MRTVCTVAAASLLVLTSFVLAAPQSDPQNREKFVISARAGGVNAVAGRASVRGRGNTEWEQLTIKEDLETGDVVKTGTDGRLEILLNPGSFLRIGENSEFELSDSSLDNLELRLIRGTAIVEATGADDTALLINITTPHTRLAIVRRGLYRLNVVPGDNTELIVRKGRVMLDRSHTKIQGGNKVVFNNESFFVAKLQKADKKKVDALDDWSKDRAEVVAQANRGIRRREMAMLMAGVNDHWARGLSGGRTSGFWFFNGRVGCYTFVPFLLGWGSPYGGSYSSSFYGGYYCCGRSPYGGSYPGPDTGVASGGSSGSTGGSTYNPPTVSTPAPSVQPRPIPAAAEQRIMRHTDRMPNP